MTTAIKRRGPSAELLRLAESLCGPLPEVSIDVLREMWEHEDIVIRCHRPADMEDAPDLAQRIRGAMGNALEELSTRARGRSEQIQQETAHELLYYWHQPSRRMANGEAAVVGVPMTVAADIHGEEVIVRLRLFGKAIAHRLAVATAAVEGLEAGVRIKRRAPHVSLPVFDLQFDRVYGHNWPEFSGGSNHVVIRCETPVSVRSVPRQDSHSHQAREIARSRSMQELPRIIRDPASIVRAGIRRIAALAPWMGLSLQTDWRTLEACLHALDIEGDGNAERWQRYSSRQEGRAIMVEVESGKIVLRGPMAPLLPYLTFFPHTHVGGECASGYGRVLVMAYP